MPRAKPALAEADVDIRVPVPERGGRSAPRVTNLEEEQNPGDKDEEESGVAVCVS
jgi:hypothetical protein